ncbi:hypothetical protein RM863_32220 [Streptomyces sp. DSM 41014]|uniref:Uncharacterized protein n=1 Tax=Streptomyces hintoniae TaxID=3075521 RepID=A0ABU2UUK0_9ACTN|nr:hypothetical protein [Streptomyces sp. DSM 41014]MDT0476803.1 hypothetical protein [Streptomyces sp. DSM 41014]
MRTTVRMWRLRSNPLRRRSDVLETWIMLLAALLLVVAVPLVGTLTALSTGHSLSRQRQDRHTATAVLVTDAPESRGGYPTADLTSGQVRWTTPGGASRTGTTQVVSGLKAGTRTTVWLDRQGNLTTAPVSVRSAQAQSVMFGALASACAGGLLLGGTSAAMWRLDTVRSRNWEREWADVGPRWRRRTG